MAIPVEAITTAALSAALDLATARQEAIAANIANANVEGYAPVHVGFDEHLAGARQALNERGRLELGDLDGLRSPANLQAVPDASGEAKVRLDVEMTHLAQNALHFQALAQALSRHLGLMALAAADGRK